MIGNLKIRENDGMRKMNVGDSLNSCTLELSNLIPATYYL